MTDAGWAERKVSKATTCPDGVSVVYAPTVEKLLKAEHARSVRIVKQYLKRYGTEGSPCELICNDLLTALQHGRGGKG